MNAVQNASPVRRRQSMKNAFGPGSQRTTVRSKVRISPHTDVSSYEVSVVSHER